MTARSTLAHSQADPGEAALPSVRETDAGADATWFSARPHRLFRTRFDNGGTWIIRRRRQGSGPDIYLRTFSRPPVQHDTDGEIAQVWFATAYPGWSPEQVCKAARKVIQRGRV
jgi:hypothetical protein